VKEKIEGEFGEGKGSMGGGGTSLYGKGL